MILIFFILFKNYVKNQIEHNRFKSTSYQQQLKKIGNAAKYSQLKAQYKAINHCLGFVNNLSLNHRCLIDSLKEISGSMPSEVRLNLLIFNENQWVLEGVSSESRSVHSFVKKLIESGLCLAHVQLAHIQEEPINHRVFFTVNAVFSEKYH